jgi:hypothetical protein
MLSSHRSPGASRALDPIDPEVGTTDVWLVHVQRNRRHLEAAVLGLAGPDELRIEVRVAADCTRRRGIRASLRDRCCAIPPRRDRR